jgi:hypothetical protein
LVGLGDDYEHQGRVLLEELDPAVLPQSLQAHHETLVDLAEVYKQLNATVGQFGVEAVRISTAAIDSNASGDRTYVDLERQLLDLGGQRDAIAGQMLNLLEGAAFSGRALDEERAKSLIEQGQELLDRVQELAGGDSGD